MSDKRYQLIYAGKLVPGLDAETVKSNLILSMGLSEDKAAKLVVSEARLLKHCATAVEARVLAEKFEQVGVICVVRDERGHGIECSSESSLVSLLKHTPQGNEDSPSLFRRLIHSRSRSKRA